MIPDRPHPLPVCRVARCCAARFTVAGLAALVALGAGTSAMAQEAEPDTAQITEPPAQAGAEAEPDALAACITDRDRLALFTTDLSARLSAAQNACTTRIDTALAPAQEALTLCQAEVAQHQRTNITLNDRLLACETRPAEDPGRIAELEAEVARLTERLSNAGLGSEPGYGYAGGSVWSSFVAGDELERVQGSLPRLGIDACPAALDWLAERGGADRPVRIQLWAWQDDDPQICRRNADGTTGLAPARPQDEAHVVIFR